MYIQIYLWTGILYCSTYIYIYHNKLIVVVLGRYTLGYPFVSTTGIIFPLTLTQSSSGLNILQITLPSSNKCLVTTFIIVYSVLLKQNNDLSL